MVSEIITKLNKGITEITIENVYDHIQKGDLRTWLDNWRDDMDGYSIALLSLFKITKKGN